MIYYKVILKQEERLFSAIERGIYRVEYILGSWVSGKYPLFVFESLEYATQFLPDYNIFHIICECEGTNPRPIEKIPFVRLYATSKIIESFWKNDTIDTEPAPLGSIVCDAVRLNKRVVL